MEAIILAGGMGTRLRDVIGNIPKPMALVNGRPFLSFLFDFLMEQGIRKVVLSTGFMGEMIQEHFNDHYGKLSIRYSPEKEPLGTGGGILHAMGKTTGRSVLVLNGDSLFRIRLDELRIIHEKANADITLALHFTEDTTRFGSVKTDCTGRITGFLEKGSGKGVGYINAGIYLVKRGFFEGYGFPERFSIEKDCFEKLYTGYRFFGYKSREYFLDIGVPEDYQKAQDELS